MLVNHSLDRAELAGHFSQPITKSFLFPGTMMMMMMIGVFRMVVCHLVKIKHQSWKSATVKNSAMGGGGIDGQFVREGGIGLGGIRDKFRVASALLRYTVARL